MDWEGMKRSALKLRGSAASAVKDLVMTEIENKTRSATADTSWRVSGSELDEIARATFHRDEYPLIMAILWQRLDSRRWRCVFKGLELLKYLCLHGSSRVIDEARDAVYHLQTLESFRYVDPKTRKDEGQNVRNKARALVELLQDDDAMEEERRKSKALKSKLTARDRDGPAGHSGYSSDDYARSSRRTDFDRYDDSNNNPRASAPYPDSSSAAAAGAPPPGQALDDILGLSDAGAGQIVPAQGAAGEVSLIGGGDDDDDDADFDPRGFAAGATVGATATAADDDWTGGMLGAAQHQQTQALPAPPGLSQPLDFAASLPGSNGGPNAAAPAPPAEPASRFEGFAAPSAPMFMQNLAMGAAKTGVAEKAASVGAATGPTSTAKPVLSDDFVATAMGGSTSSNAATNSGLSGTANGLAASAATAMSSAAFAAAASSAATSFGVGAQSTSSQSDEKKANGDDLFGGLVDFNNLMLDKDTRPEPRKAIR